MSLHLVITIDTEEGFDWHKPFSRTGYTTLAMFEHDFHMSGFYKNYKIKPISLISYPILNDEDNQKLLRQYATEKTYYLGTHLHSWVTPPLDEDLSDFNSYAHNLPADLEHKKLEVLTKKFKQVFGFSPLYYKAGRYGISNRSYEYLQNMGYMYDFSPYAYRDFTKKHGPDFSQIGNEPFYPLEDSSLLTYPATAAYVGAYQNSERFKRVFNNPYLTSLKIKSILSCFGLLNFIPLSPELASEQEMKEVTKELIHNGHKFFHLSYHSSSFSVGGTPYAKTQTDIYLLVERLKNYIHFFKEIGGSFDIQTNFHEIEKKNKKIV